MNDAILEAKQAEAKLVIDTLGGPTKAGKFCEVSKSAVSQWFIRGLPRTQRKFLMAARPDLFAAQMAKKSRRAKA